jgi:hypothetical protein
MGDGGWGLWRLVAIEATALHLFALTETFLIPHPPSPFPHPRVNDNHNRILPDVKLRTSGFQFGGRDSGSIP